MAGGAAVRLHGVSRRFGAALAVDRLALDIPAGSFTALLGPSGCGKTTTLMMLAGFERPDAGRVVIDGADVTAIPPERRGIGLVFQNYALFPHMTVAQNLAYPLRARGLPRAEVAAKVAAMAAMMEVTELLDRLPRQVSGGQRQRVAIGRAIVFSPRLLLLDEPLSALDRGLRDKMKEELRRLHRRLGITIVMVTHDQDEAMELADVIAVLERGRMIGHGSPRDLYDRPSSRALASFFGRSNLLNVARAPDGAPLLAGVRIPAGGDGTLLLLRPEQVGRATPGQAGLAATVEDAVFRGGRWAVTTRLPDGQTLTAELPAAEGDGLAPGMALQLEVRGGWLVAAS
jgi:ABC-type Fe3+/spermidine/putrescine transport system ATPase subunit